MHPITDRDEPALIAAAQAGDIDARNRLIVANMGLIHTAVSRELPRHIDPAEWHAVGIIGFIRAIMGFDESKGFRLSTYGMKCVRLYTRTQFSTKGRFIHRPHTVSQKNKAVYEQIRCCSLDTSDADGRTRMDGVRSREAYADDRSEQLEALRSAMQHIDRRERDILVLRAEGLTLGQIADRLGISRERVRQIEQVAIAAVRKHIHEGRAHVAA